MSSTQVGATTALGQGDLPAAAFSFKAWVIIAGTPYAAVNVVVTHNKTESRAICELAVGVNTRDLGGLPAIPANFKFTRGLPAQVMVQVDDDLGATPPANDTRGGYTKLLGAGVHTLFDGVVDDGGPTNLVQGRFNLNVIIVSKLIYLGTGSPQFRGLSSNVFGNGVVSLTGTADDNPVKIDTGDINDFWAAMRTSLLALTALEPTQITVGFETLQTFLDEFNKGTLTATNATLLKAIKGSLPGGVFKATSMGQFVIAFYNGEILYDPVGQTVLQRIKALAEDFGYALIENGYGFAVVPYTPFVAQSLIKTTIWPNTVYDAQWQSNSTAMIAGLAFIDCVDGANFGAPPKSAGDSTFALLGKYVRPGTPIASNTLDPLGKGLGALQCLHSPQWLSGATSNADALAFQQEALDASGVNSIREFGDPYARECALKQTYQGRALRVVCPFRMDIGPCTPVKMVYPDVAGTGLINAAAIYGSVESVTIQLNASSKQAGTILEIMYVRSEQQQILDIDPGPFGGDGVTKFPYPHPIWAGTYLGQRLDEAPDFQASGTSEGATGSSGTGAGGTAPGADQGPIASSRIDFVGTDAFTNVNPDGNVAV